MPFDHSPPTKPHLIAESDHTYTKQLHQIYAGAIAGCATRAATQPFDVLKIRLQLQVEPVSMVKQAERVSKYTSLWQAFRIIYQEEGIRAFWKGHNSGQCTSVTYGVAQFWTYERLKDFVKDTPIFKQHRYLTDFFCGGIAGMMAALISTPFDVIRTRIVAADHGAGYRNMFQAFYSISQNEGIAGLYRGLTPTLIQIVPLVGLNFLIYSCLNDLAEKILHSENGHLSTWVLLTTGGIAGTTSKILIYPLDFIKKRLQIRGFEKQRTTYGRTQQCRTVLDCARMTIREEGYLGFYKGLSPTLYKAGLTTALYFAVYDRAKEMLDMPSAD